MIYEVWDHIQKKYGPRKKLEREELCVGVCICMCWCSGIFDFIVS